MIDINNFDAISIGLASSKQIRSWSSGEVTKPETINYRTLKPEKDGLFCERIFGPTKDWECYCGKYKRVRYKGIVCERCGVEVTRSKVRRERMGHVDLAAPVSHIWFFKGVPSPHRLPARHGSQGAREGPVLRGLDRHVGRRRGARRRTSTSSRRRSTKVLDSYAAEKEERVLELRESLERREEYLQTGKQTGLHRRGPPVGRRARHQRQEALRRGAREAAEGPPQGLRLRHLRHRGLHRGRRRAHAPGLGPLPDDEAEGHRSPTRPSSASSRTASARRTASASTSAAAWAPRRSATCSSRSTSTPSAIELEDQVKTAKGQKQARAVKRLKVVSAFIHSGNKPEHMILEAVPVIPPELRPMVQLDGGRFATSDLNDLYRRVINRNNRLKRLLDLGAPEIIVNNEKRMLQEAVDALFDNGRRGRPVTGPGNRAAEVAVRHAQGQAGPLPPEPARQARRLLRAAR